VAVTQSEALIRSITPDLHTSVPGDWDLQTKLHFRLDRWSLEDPCTFTTFFHNPSAFWQSVTVPPVFEFAIVSNVCEIILSRLPISLEAFVHVRLCGAGR
jgi:hypothetical protein